MSTMKKGRGSLEKTESRDAWIMMTPALIVLTIVAVYPILRTFWLSLHEMVLTDPTSGYPFVGLGNYIKIFQDSRALTALVFTLKFTVVTVFFETILGFICDDHESGIQGKRLRPGSNPDSVGDSDLCFCNDVEIYLQRSVWTF